MIFSVSLIVLFAPLCLWSQIKAIPDSIMLLQDKNGKVGYLFPKIYAIEYLKLRQKVLVQTTTLIDSLNLKIQKQDTMIENKNQQNIYFRQMLQNDSLAIQKQAVALNEAEAGINKLQFKLKFWKYSAAILGAAGFVVGLLLGR